MRKGQTIKIKINGKEHDTIIDVDNVQRFPVNQLVRYLIDSNKVDLNDLCIDYQNGKFTLDEYQEFYRGMGYSVSGFDEIFGSNGNLEEEQQARIENPLWD